MLRLTFVALVLASPAVIALAETIQGMPVVRLAGQQGRKGPDSGQATAPRSGVEGQQPPAPPRSGTQLPPLPVTQIDAASAVAVLDAPRHVTLTFVEARPIDEVLHLLVADTPFSLAIDADVTGAFRGELRDLTLREALTTLLAPLGLDFALDGTVIHVSRHRTDTRQFDLNVLDVQRTLQRTTGVAAAAASTSQAGRVALTSSAPADDVFAAIGEGIQALLSTAGRVHIDRRAGLATVTDYPERLDLVGLYLETLQVRSSRQVRVQAQAFEVMLTARPSIDWRAVRERLGVPSDAPTAGLATDLGALRDALAIQGDLRMLWAPEVTTINNEPALMRIETPGVESLTLTVVPQISSDGIIQLAVTHTWEERAADRKEGLTKSTPIERVTEADTVTRLSSGSSVLLSGILRPVQIPKQVSGAAALFGAQPKRDGYAELVVVLRPTIVTIGMRN